MATMTLNLASTKATGGKSELVKWLLREAAKVGFPRARYLPSEDGDHAGDIVALSDRVWAGIDHDDDTFRLHRHDDGVLRSGDWYDFAARPDLAGCLSALKRAPVVQEVFEDAPDDVPVAATPTRPKPAPKAEPAPAQAKAAKSKAAPKVNGKGKQVRKPARRRPDPKVAVVKFLCEKQLRESFYLKLFKIADPAETMAMPHVLTAVARARSKDAAVADKQERALDAARARQDVACLSAISGWILGSDRATKSRLQDLPEKGFARLVELAAILSGESEDAGDVLEVLGGIRDEVLAAIDKLAGPAPEPEPAPAPKAKAQPKAKAAVVQTAKPAKRPAQANPKPKGYSHKEEIHPDGAPSEIERGNITKVDDRAAKALRAAVDAAIKDVADRFNLGYSVVRGVAAGWGVDVRVRLEVKGSAPITIHQSDAEPVVAPAPQGKPLPPQTKTLSKTARKQLKAANAPKKAKKASKAK